MARSEVTIQIKVSDLEAFRIAYGALQRIVGAEGIAGVGRQIAEGALRRIDDIGPVPSLPKTLPPDQIKAPRGIGINQSDGGSR